jgi:threonine/homoserine/homoserine lactone efflux protein
MLEFAFGYAAVLAVPGPNMLAVGGLAALRGFRAAIPISLGVAAGATALAGFMDAAIATASGLFWERFLQVLGAVLLVSIACHVIKLRPEAGMAQRRLRTPAAEFVAGFCTAATNPITAGYFAGTFSNRLIGSSGSAIPALVTVPAVALAVCLSLSGLLACQTVRKAIHVWHLPMRLGTASVLVFMASMMLLR